MYNLFISLHCIVSISIYQFIICLRFKVSFFKKMNPELLIFPNYLQTEQAMASNEEVLAELRAIEAKVGIRPRDESNQPGSRNPYATRNCVPNRGTFAQWSNNGNNTMTSYLKTAHMWNKDENGNVTGRCIHKGCDVHCAAAEIPVNCVGNNKYRVEDGVVISETKSGTGVYTRKVL